VYALTPGIRPSFGLRQICCADFAYTILAVAFLHGVSSVAAVSVGFQRVPGPRYTRFALSVSRTRHRVFWRKEYAPHSNRRNLSQAGSASRMTACGSCRVGKCSGRPAKKSAARRSDAFYFSWFFQCFPSSSPPLVRGWPFG